MCGECSCNRSSVQSGSWNPFFDAEQAPPECRSHSKHAEQHQPSQAPRGSVQDASITSQASRKGGREAHTQHTQTPTHTSTHTHTRTQTHTHTPPHTHTAPKRRTQHTQTANAAHAHTNAHTRKQTHTHTHTHTHTQETATSTNTNTHKHTPNTHTHTLTHPFEQKKQNSGITIRMLHRKIRALMLGKMSRDIDAPNQVVA